MNVPRALLARVRPYRVVIATAMLLGLLGSAAGLAQPLAAREVIEALAAGESLVPVVGVLAALVVAGTGVALTHYWLLERTAQHIVYEARRGLGSRLIRLRVQEVDRRPPGELVAMATSDTTLLGEVASTGFVQIVNGAVGLIGAIVLMGVVDLPLLGATLTVLVVVGLAVSTLLPRIARSMERSQAAVGELGAVLERSLGAIRTVKASGAEEREIARIDDAAGRAYRRGLESAGYQAVIGASTGLIVQVAFLTVLGLGGARVAEGTLAVADLIAFLLYLFYISEPVAQLAQGATQLQGGVAALRRLGAVEALESEEAEGDDSGTAVAAESMATESVRGLASSPAVVFDRVSFRYPGSDSSALDDVSFVVPPRGLTAVVGPSGAGKSTLFALLERFYEPEVGRIEFAGSQISQWRRADLRAQMAYVEQEAPVLAGTLADNLRYAAPEATDSELAAALAATRLDALIERLPDGLLTEVGSRGLGLSGGERQRIAIARALLRSPKLLLLDEASSQLDAVNEQALREVVSGLARDRAVVTIAHRLSTVVQADQILVLEGGRLRATGTHHELLRSDELYHRLAMTQLTAPVEDRRGAGDSGVEERLGQALAAAGAGRDG